MNELFGGWETGAVLTDGWDDVATLTVTTANPSLDFEGQGGARNVRGTLVGLGTLRSKWQKPHRDLKEGWFRVKASCNSTNNNNGFAWEWYDGSTLIGAIVFLGSLQQFDYYRGVTFVASSSSPAFPVNQYFVMDVHFFMDGVAGLLEIFVDDDGTYTTPIFSFSGDTTPGSETTFNRPGIAMSSSSDADEYGVNSITMLYDGGVGTAASPGDVLTGGTSGATVVVTADEGDGVTGRLVLQQWSGTAFVDNESITGGTFDADVDAPTAAYVNGFEANSAALGEGFVVALAPTGPGATTGLTSSTVNANWENVDEIPVSDVDYNLGETNGLYDTYVLSNLPSSAISILRTGTYNWAAKDGTVLNNLKGVVRSGGVDFFGTAQPLGTDFSVFLQPWDVNPSTDDAWSVLEVNAAQSGPQVLT